MFRRLTYSAAVIFVILAVCLPAYANPVRKNIPGGIRIEDKISDVVREDLVRRNPAYENSRIGITYKDADPIFLELEAIKGPLGFKIDFPENRRMVGRLILPLDVYAGGKFYGKISLKSVVAVFTRVVSAAVKINKGEVITDRNVRFIERDVAAFPSTLILDKQRVIGKEAVTFIPEGTALLDWMAKKTPDIKKGEIINLVKAAFGINLRTKAMAMEDGYIGKIVNIKNVDSNKMIEGRVNSSSEVEAL